MTNERSLKLIKTCCGSIRNHLKRKDSIESGLKLDIEDKLEMIETEAESCIEEQRRLKNENKF